MINAVMDREAAAPAEGERLPNIHPGDVLREDFLRPLQMTPAHILELYEAVPEWERGQFATFTTTSSSTRDDDVSLIE